MAALRDGRPGAKVDRAFEVFGETVILREDPAGQPLDAAVIEEIVPPGVGAPLHRHTQEDEICYVIDGTFRIWRGEEAFDLGPGGVALLPRHQAHSFQNVGPAPGRLLTVIVPAGFERFFAVVAERGLGEADVEGIATAAAAFGLEILGPPPA
jgi:mannose-6-phosphate isomerase-like protein (cupin superfamily)